MISSLLCGLRSGDMLFLTVWNLSLLTNYPFHNRNPSWNKKIKNVLSSCRAEAVMLFTLNWGTAKGQNPSLALCCFPQGVWRRAVTPSLLVPRGWLPCPRAFFHCRGVWQHEESDSKDHSRDGSATALPHRVLHQRRGAAPGAGTEKGRVVLVGALEGKREKANSCSGFTLGEHDSSNWT